jgi:N-acetylglucosaminyldiphosphoundecaprenol N-acetyl-beta-D-mannosaminyltransferase
MAHRILAGVPVRTVVSGSVVERCNTDEVVSIIAARLRFQSPGLAMGSVDLDHLHHFRTLGAAPTGRLEWLLPADGTPIDGAAELSSPAAEVATG